MNPGPRSIIYSRPRSEGFLLSSITPAGHQSDNLDNWTPDRARSSARADQNSLKLDLNRGPVSFSLLSPGSETLREPVQVLDPSAVRSKVPTPLNGAGGVTAAKLRALLKMKSAAGPLAEVEREISIPLLFSRVEPSNL